MSAKKCFLWIQSEFLYYLKEICPSPFKSQNLPETKEYSAQPRLYRSGASVAWHSFCDIVPPVSKKILIIDEAGFSRVCSAIFEIEGLKAEVVDASAPSGAVAWEALDVAGT